MSRFNKVVEEDEDVYGEYLETVGKKIKPKKPIPYYEIFD